MSPFRSAAAVAAVVGGSLTFLGAPAPAGAQTCYPPSSGCVTTTTRSGAVLGAELRLPSTSLAGCQTISPAIAGFKPGTTGILTIASVEQQIGSFTVPANGVATSTITIPATISVGAHTVYARGTLSDGTAGTASQGITVTAGCRGGSVVGSGGGGGGTGGGKLARTGMVVVPTALIGAGLVLGGLALKRSGSRRKTNVAS